MLVEKRDGSRERAILTGMIVSDSVLSRIAPKWDRKQGNFQSTWCNVVGNWCVDFYDKYGKAPGKSIEGLFQSWADGKEDKDTIKLVEKFLTELSGQYVRTKKKINADYVVDQAAEHFNKVRLTRLVDSLQGHIDSGKLDEAWKAIHKVDKVELGTTGLVSLFRDETEVISTFDQELSAPLIQYPGALGQFFGKSLKREGFIAFLAPEKRGKSTWLVDMAFRAVKQRRRVLFLEIGDLSKRETKERFLIRLAGRPQKPTKVGSPLEYPVSIEVNHDTNKASVKTISRSYDDELDGYTHWKACQKFMAEKVKSNRSFFELSTHFNNTLSMQGVKAIMRQLERDDWIPDVVVIDYADLLAPPPGYKGDSRDAINENWKEMSALRLEYHCLLLTATQSNAASYTKDSLDMSNFSEDKRKFAHCTGMVGLNQDDDEEKKDGIMRLNWLVRRDEEFFVRKHVFVAGCMAIANPAIRSSF